MILQFLSTHGIPFHRTDHPPVFTCEEAASLVPAMAGAPTKNLFLRDEKGRRHFIVAVTPAAKVDLKALGTLIGAKGLSFGSEDRLRRCLGVSPGAVSLLAVHNDRSHEVQVIIDRKLWDAEALLCHPLVNTSTLSLSTSALEAFFRATGHAPLFVNVPEREQPAEGRKD